MLTVNQRRLYRTVETRDFKVDDQITIDLPLGYDLNSVVVKLSGTITVGTVPTTYHTHAVPRLIDRLDLYSNGKNKFAEVTGLVACLGNFPAGLARTLTDISAGTGAKTVEAFFRLDAENTHGHRPKDTALHTNKPFMSKLQIKITTNNFNDMCASLGSFAVSSNTLKLEVMVEETQEYNDAAYFEDRLVKVSSLIQETISASNSQFRVKLSTGELMTRGVIVTAFDENLVLSNALVNTAQLKSGTDVACYKSWSDYREQNRRNYTLDTAQLPDGFAFIDLCPDGNLNQLWDTRGRSELDLVVDVTKPAGGNGTLVVIPVQYYEQDNAQLRTALLNS